MLGALLFPVWLTSPSEPWNKKLKLKSLLTNPSLADTKSGNTIGLIKLIGLVCPARGLTCQSNMDVCAVTNSGNSFSFPLEAGVRIGLTTVHVIGQACADCSCQSIRKEFSSCFHSFEVSWMKIIVNLRESCYNKQTSWHSLFTLWSWKNISRYLCSRGGQGRRDKWRGFFITKALLEIDNSHTDLILVTAFCGCKSS